MKDKTIVSITRLIAVLTIIIEAVLLLGLTVHAAEIIQEPKIIYSPKIGEELIPVAIAEPEESDVPEPVLEYLGEYTLTYYCPCRKCNGKWGAIDGFGNPLEWGCVAVDKSVIRMHTKLIIDGYDTVFEARDTGSGVDGKHIDIYVPVSHAEALMMGQGERRKVWKVVE